MRHLLLILAVTTLLIIGCSPAAASASLPEDIEETAVIAALTHTPEPTLIPTLPPTPTPVPTHEAVATAQSGEVLGVLDWLYVDAQRLVFRASIHHLSPDLLAASQDQSLFIMPTVLDANNEMLNASFGGGSGAELPQEPDVLSFIGSIEFYTPLMTDPLPSDPLDLTLELALEQPTGTSIALRFPIQVQPTAPRYFDVYETQAANGIAVTLNTVTFTPSLVSLYICYDMPPGSRDWQPDAKISLDSHPYDTWWITSMSHGEFYTNDSGASGRCITLKYLAPYRDDGSGIITSPNAQSLSIAIPRLIASAPESLTEERKARAHQRLAERGIEVEFDIAQGYMGWTLIHAPAGMTEAEIGPLVWEALSDLHDGPWHFTIPLN